MVVVKLMLILIFLFERDMGVQGGNVLVFPLFFRSQLLSATRMASILSDDGHNVTIVMASNDEKDIKKSSKYNIVFYDTSLSREEEQSAFKQGFNAVLNLGRLPMGFFEVLKGRCSGVLFNDEIQRKISVLKPDVAIVHSMLGCIIPYLNHIKVPFLDFCSVTLVHSMCGYPHRIPAPPSYVPDVFMSNEPKTFFERVVNTLIYLIAPQVAKHIMFGGVHQEIYKYQEIHNLPFEDMDELRSKASFLLIHGDITYEYIRPLIPKVVYVGGVQCDDPKPLNGDLYDFVAGSGDAGVIVFALGGVLNTQMLPDRFIEIFLRIFSKLPHRVVWKLKSVPAHIQKQVPSNVKIVDWMPQQDLIGHPKTKLFISHGGIQSSFESICHGVPVLGVIISGDQSLNVQILASKGMALIIDNYKTMEESDVRDKIQKLLSDPSFAQKATYAQTLYKDQPLSAAQRIAFSVNYTLRHNGAHHLTSTAALQLYWFQYYSLDVYLFLCVLFLVAGFMICLAIKTCCRCCVYVCKGRKKSEKAD